MIIALFVVASFQLLWHFLLYSPICGSFISAPKQEPRFSFNAAMSACERGGQWPMALKLLFEDMASLAQDDYVLKNPPKNRKQ